MAYDSKTLYLLTGPTACGKTDYAIEWALYHDAEILSCDSLLFYKHMDIGTAKPTKAQLNKVKHHGIDLVNPDEPMDIKDYLEYAVEAVRDIHRRGKKVLVVGGSGFYLKAFYAPVIDYIEPSLETIKTVNDIYEEGGLGALLQALEPYNPGGLPSRLDQRNPRRVIKALERCMTTGKSFEELYEAFEGADFPFKGFSTFNMLIYRKREELKERIRLRVDKMLEAGLVEEFRSLIETFPKMRKVSSTAGSIGYRELMDNGPIDNIDLLIKKNTLLLLNKQIKWFRNNYNHHIYFYS